MEDAMTPWNRNATDQDHLAAAKESRPRLYTVRAIRGDAIREFEVEATCPDEARLIVERDLAGEWEWERLVV